MANKRITEVGFINSLNSNESFFVNQNSTIKQINKGDITFDIINGGTGAKNAEGARANLGLGSVATEDVLPISKGGTGATTAAAALTNLGITATAKELNYVDGVTSNIQTQLNNVQTQLNDKVSKSSSELQSIAGDISIGGKLILSEGAYGSSLPTDAVEGQLFFVFVEEESAESVETE